MKWIGLTGGIATGKSTVAQILRNQGIPVIDADQVAHQALVASSPVFAKLIATFGQDILGADGNVDRQKLGQKIFQDEHARASLEAIVHPFVRAQVAREKLKLQNQNVSLAVYDVPLLFEKNMEKDFDQILVVVCDEDLQKQRLKKRNQLTDAEALQRIQAQWPLREKTKRATQVIENNGTPKDLEREVHRLLLKLNFIPSGQTKN